MTILGRALRAPRRLAEWAIRSRSSFPRWLNRAIDHVADNPDGLLGRLAARSMGTYGPEDVPPPTAPPAAARRVYIGPTNYAAQGWSWARSLDASGADVGARNMAVEVPGGFSFAADTEVPVAVYHRSHEWQLRELEAVGAFTHVLFEAERPLFGRLFSRDVAAEVAALEERGVATGFMCHGTDVRLPSAHVDLTPWSPYHDPGLYLERYENEARRNRALLDRLDRPTFVSTPDLLVDVPYATWCPVVVDPRRWARPQRTPGGPLVVAHVPSHSTIKGTHLIRPALERLHAEGIVDYREISGVPSAQMPDLYGAADVVLDQFRLGSYGVAACEAMAAGRIVVGHVVPQVRDTVLRETGLELPVVEATPDTVEERLRALADDPAYRAEVSAAGVGFVDRVHDGRRSASILLEKWVDA